MPPCIRIVGLPTVVLMVCPDEPALGLATVFRRTVMPDPVDMRDEAGAMEPPMEPRPSRIPPTAVPIANPVPTAVATSAAFGPSEAGS